MLILGLIFWLFGAIVAIIEAIKTIRSKFTNKLWLGWMAVVIMLCGNLLISLANWKG